jgi:hypothetical protein
VTDTSTPTLGRSSAQLLILIGILWLLLAAALFIYQIAVPPRVEITWETATEQNTVGFNLYRSTTPDGSYTLVNEGQFIASQGSPVSGASYVFTDDDVSSAQTYYYVLEEIEADGSSIRYEDDLFEYQVPGLIWWLILLTIAAALIGLGMVYAGLQERKKQ